MNTVTLKDKIFLCLAPLNQTTYKKVVLVSNLKNFHIVEYESETLHPKYLLFSTTKTAYSTKKKYTNLRDIKTKDDYIFHLLIKDTLSPVIVDNLFEVCLSLNCLKQRIRDAVKKRSLY